MLESVKTMTSGVLYLVATPIGNLGDITLRALEVLKTVDLIAAEDTRRTTILLHHYNIKKPLISYYEEIEERRSGELLVHLLNGQKIALVTDAGTPLLSDPGYRLVEKAIRQDVRVEAIPGASAILTALSASGLATDRFVFEGFLPRKKGRQTRLRELACEPRTIVLFEAANRLLKTLQELVEYFGDRQAVCARELTKIHEEYRRGKLSDILAYYSKKTPKGEIVIVMAGKSKTTLINPEFSQVK